MICPFCPSEVSRDEIRVKCKGCKNIVYPFVLPDLKFNTYSEIFEDINVYEELIISRDKSIEKASKLFKKSFNEYKTFRKDILISIYKKYEYSHMIKFSNEDLMKYKRRGIFLNKNLNDSEFLYSYYKTNTDRKIYSSSPKNIGIQYEKAIRNFNVNKEEVTTICFNCGLYCCRCTKKKKDLIELSLEQCPHGHKLLKSKIDFCYECNEYYRDNQQIILHDIPKINYEETIKSRHFLFGRLDIIRKRIIKRSNLVSKYTESTNDTLNNLCKYKYMVQYLEATNEDYNEELYIKYISKNDFIRGYFYKASEHIDYFEYRIDKISELVHYF